MEVAQKSRQVQGSLDKERDDRLDVPKKMNVLGGCLSLSWQVSVAHSPQRLGIHMHTYHPDLTKGH